MSWINKFLCLLFCLSLSHSAFASQLTVVDCAGMPRLIKDINDEKNLNIKVSTSLPSQTDVLELTNIRTGEVIKGTTINGFTTFKNIRIGTWKACPTAPAAVITNVSAEAISTSYIIPAAISSLGIIGGGIALSNSSGNSDGDVNTASNIPTAPVKPATTHTNTHSGTSQNNENEIWHTCPQSSAIIHNSDCETGGNPTPLSPIS